MIKTQINKCSNYYKQNFIFFVFMKNSFYNITAAILMMFFTKCNKISKIMSYNKKYKNL